MMKQTVVLSGYAGINQIIKVRGLPRVGVTEIVQNTDNTRPYYGGNSVNVAYCLAKLGVGARPIVRGGCDFAATGFEAFLRDGGCICDAVTTVPHDATPICYLVEDEAKNHLTLFYPGSMRGEYAPETQPDAYFADACMAVLAVGARQDNINFLAKVKQLGLPLAFGMRADFDAFPKELLGEILHTAKIIFTNEGERALIEELFALESITQLLEQGSAEIIVTTLGAQGSVVYEKCGNGICESVVAATQCEEVVDATGAGDAYIAGFLYGYLGGKPAQTCAEYGSTLSSFVIEQVGCLANVPTEEQLLDRNEKGRS